MLARMNPALAFVCCLGGIVLIAFVVSRITGARAHYLEAFALQPGERVLWEDLGADAYPIQKRRALITSYVRSRKYGVRVTSLRILSGRLALFGSKHMVQHVLYPSDRAFPNEADTLGGGLLTRGYETFVFERASQERGAGKSDGRDAYVEVTLSPSVASSMNLIKFRIYSEQLESFRLPE